MPPSHTMRRRSRPDRWRLLGAATVTTLCGAALIALVAGARSGPLLGAALVVGPVWLVLVAVHRFSPVEQVVAALLTIVALMILLGLGDLVLAGDALPVHLVLLGLGTLGPSAAMLLGRGV